MTDLQKELINADEALYLAKEAYQKQCWSYVRSIQDQLTDDEFWAFMDELIQEIKNRKRSGTVASIKEGIGNWMIRTINKGNANKIIPFFNTLHYKEKAIKTSYDQCNDTWSDFRDSLPWRGKKVYLKVLKDIENWETYNKGLENYYAMTFENELHKRLRWIIEESK